MIACPVCARENAAEFAFCPGCGTKLAAVAEATAVAEANRVAEPHALTEERKVVSTLFCDLVSYTAHSEAADHELIDALLQRYNALTKKLVEGYGGVVEKFIGDAVLAVFGFPRTHDDDAERAVRCALELASETAALTWPDGDSCQVRIGVNSGETYLHTDIDPSSGETFLTGDAVNTAARLETAALPGGVVVGELTYALTDKAIAYEELPLLTLKGKAEPVPAWLAKEVRNRTGLRTLGKLDTPFLGRQRELAALQDALESASSTNDARLVLLVGEPGIGKSRLMLEFARALEERPEFITWRQGRCLAYGDAVGFAPLSEIVKAHAGILDSDDVAAVEAKLDAVLPEGHDRTWLRQRLRPLLGLEASPASQEENFAAWTLFLKELVSSGPVVLVVEDLHWAGEGMLAFVEQVAAQKLGVPLIVVATTRPELLQRHPELLATCDDAQRLTLAPLTRRDSGRLVTALLDERVASEVRAPILERVSGNPLFAEEYVRLLFDRGLLHKTGGLLRLKEGGELPLPDTVHAVLAARLDTLPPDDKALFCAAAVFGESFSAGGVAALGGRTSDEVAAVMAALAERQLVRPVVSPPGGETEYLFWHALARDVAYEHLPHRERMRKHEEAALWIAAQAGERVDDVAELLAHHYVTALDWATALDDEAVGRRLRDPAVAALRRSARQAGSTDAAASERQLSRALELLPPDDPRRPAVRADWAMALQDVGDHAKAVPALEKAAAELQAVGEVRLAMKTLAYLAWAYDNVGRDSSPFLGQALSLLEGDGPSVEAIFVLQNAANADFNRGRGAQGLAHAERALAVAKALGLSAVYNDDVLAALLTRGAIRCQLGDASGLDDVRQAAEAALAEGSAIRLVYTHAFVALCVLGPVPAIPLLEQYLELYHDRGLRTFEATVLTGLVTARRAAGRWDEALGAFEGRRAEFEAAGEVTKLLDMRLQVSRVLVYRGETEGASRMIAGCLTAARESCVWLADALIAVAAVEIDTDATHARSCLEELASLIDSTLVFFSVLDLPDMLRSAHSANSLALAEELTRLIPTGLPTQLCVRTYGEALLAETRGEYTAAATGFADAAPRWHDFGMPYEEAQALLGQGRCLTALGRGHEAKAHLAAAREIFARLGAKPALAEVELLLSEGTATPR